MDSLQVYAEFFDYTSTSTSFSGATDFVKLFDDAANYTEITGTGFAGTVVGGELVAVTGGTLQTFNVSVNGVLAVNATGLASSLKTAFEAAATNNRLAFFNELMKGNDTITGTAAADVIFGANGVDAISGGNGNDVLRGGNGNDTLRGGNQNDTLKGENNNDFLFGDAGADTLDGGTGRDIFNGGTGNDKLVSRIDATEDIFVFSNTYGADTISFFEEGLDTLRLNDDLWGGGLTAAQVVASFATVNAAGTVITLNFGDADILRVGNTAGGLDLASIVGDIVII